MYQELAAAQADVAIARTGEQVHPVFCLVRRSAHPTLRSFLDTGGRKADKWFMPLRVVQVAFDDQPAAFANINTLDELQHWESHD
jgi:molybdopterin-guanine dinucleotide biosynthesis protein A